VLRELVRVHALSTNEAETLLCSFLSTVRHRLYLEPGEVRDDQYQRILALVKLLKKNVPIQYVLKEAWFLDYKLYIEEGIFIPRAETEGLVLLIKQVLTAPPEHIIDVGVGTGCISIALAHFFPRSKITGIDISERALAVAARNINRYRLTDRVRLVRSDLFSRFDEPMKADLIVSNPPYLRSRDIPGLPESVRFFEPWVALDGGADGTTFIRSLLDGAPGFFKSGSRIALEIDPHAVDPLKSYLDRSPCYRGYRFEKDLAGFNRYLMIDSQ